MSMTFLTPVAYAKEAVERRTLARIWEEVREAVVEIVKEENSFIDWRKE